MLSEERLQVVALQVGKLAETDTQHVTIGSAVIQLPVASQTGDTAEANQVLADYGELLQ